MSIPLEWTGLSSSTTRGSYPQQRAGGSLIWVDFPIRPSDISETAHYQQAIYFGGYLSTRLNDIHIIERVFEEVNGKIKSDQWKWIKPTVKGMIPCPRAFHCSWVERIEIPTPGFNNENNFKLTRNYLFVHGGSNDNRHSLSDCFCLDLTTFHWRRVYTQAEPPARNSHGVVGLGGGKAIIFGGRSTPEGISRNDLWMIDLSCANFGDLLIHEEPHYNLSLDQRLQKPRVNVNEVWGANWLNIEPEAPKKMGPTPRFSFGMCRGPKRTTCQTDKGEVEEWTVGVEGGEAKIACRFASKNVGEVFVHGGISSIPGQQDRVLSDLWKLDMKSTKWFWERIDELLRGRSPGSICDHNICVVDERGLGVSERISVEGVRCLVIAGGSDKNREARPYFGNVAVLDLDLKVWLWPGISAWQVEHDEKSYSVPSTRRYSACTSEMQHGSFLMLGGDEGGRVLDRALVNGGGNAKGTAGVGTLCMLHPQQFAPIINKSKRTLLNAPDGGCGVDLLLGGDAALGAAEAMLMASRKQVLALEGRIHDLFIENSALKVSLDDRKNETKNFPSSNNEILMGSTEYETIKNLAKMEKQRSSLLAKQCQILRQEKQKNGILLKHLKKTLGASEHLSTHWQNAFKQLFDIGKLPLNVAHIVDSSTSDALPLSQCHNEALEGLMDVYKAQGGSQVAENNLIEKELQTIETEVLRITKIIKSLSTKTERTDGQNGGDLILEGTLKERSSAASDLPSARTANNQNQILTSSAQNKLQNKDNVPRVPLETLVPRKDINKNDTKIHPGTNRCENTFHGEDSQSNIDGVTINALINPSSAQLWTNLQTGRTSSTISKAFEGYRNIGDSP